jgi:hypothetical protein
MATRLYLPSTGSAAITPGFASGWEDTSIGARLPCYTTKQSTTMTTVSFVDANDTNRDILFRQYISEPLANQSIDAQSVVFRIRALERATTCNMFTTINIRLVSNDGSVVRGTLVSMRRDGVEAATSLTNRNNTGNSTAIVCHSGDRLVIEIGMGGDPGAGSDHDSDMRIGDADATDLGANDTDTSDFNPYVEFANTLSFFTAGDIIVHEISASVDANVTGKTLAHTVSANLANRGLLVMAGAYDPASTTDRNVSSITYNGVALTKQVERDGDPTMATNAEWWYLENPATGTNNLVVTMVGQVDELNTHAVTLGNVAQSGQPDNTDSELDTAVFPTDIDITTVTDRAFVFSLGTSNVFGGQGVGSGQTLIDDANGYWVTSYSGPKTPAGSVTHTYNNGNTDDAILIAVSVKPFVSGVTLVVQDATIATTMDAPALTQKHTLAVQDALVAMSADSATLTQKHLLVVQDMLVATSADNAVLIQDIALVVADLLISTSADPITLTQKHLLAVQDALVSTSSDNAVLTQKHTLVVADMDISMSADGPVLTQKHTIIVQDALVSMSADNAGLTQKHTIAVADMHVALTIEEVMISSAAMLAVNDMAVQMTSDNLAITQKHTLAVQDALVSMTADPVAILQKHHITVADLLVTNSMDALVITQKHQLAVADMLIGLAAENVILSQSVALILADLQVLTSIDTTALPQRHVLTVADISLQTIIEAVILTQRGGWYIKNPAITPTPNPVAWYSQNSRTSPSPNNTGWYNKNRTEWSQ